MSHNGPGGGISDLPHPVAYSRQMTGFIGTSDPAAPAWRKPALWALLGLGVSSLLGTCSARPGVLEQVRTLGELRVATRNSPGAYYLGAHGPEGPEYELASRFAARLGVPARFITLPSPAAVLDAVASGRAHIGAAGLAVTPEWSRLVAFSTPYQKVRLHVVERRDREHAEDLTDLDSDRLAVVAGSAHAQVLTALAPRVPGFRFRQVKGVDTLDLLDRVWSGELESTVANSNEFMLTRNYHPELKVAFNLGTGAALAWALPRGDPALADRANEFIRATQPEIPLLIARYYAPSDRFDYAGARSIVRDLEDRLPPLRNLFEKTAAEVGEDWRVLAAIGYQESRWNPDAVSPTGVRGIMMLTAETASALGVTDRTNVAESIRGGAQYLQRMHESVPDRVPEPDRLWLALASYNIGYGHLEDARVLAESNGKNPDSWQDVREFLPLLAQERYYTKTKRGYARGWEAVRFVDNVRGYFDVIEWIIPDPGSPTGG